MTSKPRIWLVVVSVCAVFVLASCETLDVSCYPSPGPGRKIGHGPPAHAKAHGYRRKQVGGYELTFDAGRGVYVVVGLTNHYYHEGYFYRLRGDAWEISLRADGGWAPTARKSLPPGLQARSKGKGHKKSAS
ncbi:MAG: hypothetical protein JSU70_17485 [Phycisphaerales bacterium]|nr:MAG: hypothetical protein JSU70_17485 [Phycisphaerales bacterium]